MTPSAIDPADLQVYVTVHKPYRLDPACRWIHPVAVGGYMSPDIPLRDDQGDNIAHLNPYYCELTTKYWVWKNRPSLYVGFCHYRRYLDFCPPCTPGADPLHHLTAVAQRDALLRLLALTEVVISHREHLGESVRAHYERYVPTGSWEHCLQAIRDIHPDYARFLPLFDLASISTTRNLFVMPWALFDDYMNAFMPVADRAFRLAGLSGDAHCDRYPGFLAERFLGLWLHTHRIRSVEVPFAMVE